MATRYQIAGTQKFTDSGTFGAWLFVLSPFVSGASYAWLMNELAERYSPNIVVPSLILILAGLAFFGGCVMMLIGRRQQYDFHVTEIPDVKPSEQSEEAWLSPLGPRRDHKWK